MMSHLESRNNAMNYIYLIKVHNDGHHDNIVKISFNAILVSYYKKNLTFLCSCIIRFICIIQINLIILTVWSSLILAHSVCSALHTNKNLG